MTVASIKNFTFANLDAVKKVLRHTSILCMNKEKVLKLYILIIQLNSENSIYNSLGNSLDKYLTKSIKFKMIKKQHWIGLIQLMHNLMLNKYYSKSTIPKLERRIFSCWTKSEPVAYSVSNPTANPNIAHLCNHQTDIQICKYALVRIQRTI